MIISSAFEMDKPQSNTTQPPYLMPNRSHIKPLYMPYRVGVN